MFLNQQTETIHAVDGDETSNSADVHSVCHEHIDVDIETVNRERLEMHETAQHAENICRIRESNNENSCVVVEVSSSRTVRTL